MALRTKSRAKRDQRSRVARRHERNKCRSTEVQVGAGEKVPRETRAQEHSSEVEGYRKAHESPVSCKTSLCAQHLSVPLSVQSRSPHRSLFRAS
eukprot:759529-Hanusia_phi.AAC.2